MSVLAKLATSEQISGVLKLFTHILIASTEKLNVTAKVIKKATEVIQRKNNFSCSQLLLIPNFSRFSEANVCHYCLERAIGHGDRG
jgi:hypothetical protein